MTDTMNSDRSAQGRPFVVWLVERGWWFWVICVSIILMLGGLVGGYLFGRELARSPLADAMQLIQQLQPESQRLKTEVSAQTATIAALQAKLKSVQDALEAMSPAANTYTIGANQSVNVADGRLVVGLIGSPGNQSVIININGKQHTAVSGDDFDVVPDPSTSCHVKIESFDMFKATVTASCMPMKSMQGSDKP